MNAYESAVALYTHQITVIRVVPGLGNVEQKFRTTDDAVEMHRGFLIQAVKTGKAVSFEITGTAS